MTSGGDDVTRSALRAYDDAGLTTRWHVRIRAATCPMAELDALVPASGRVLDIGCGHGLGAIRMALARPQRTILGVDVDDSKISIARRAAQHAGVADRVRFEHVPESWQPTADVVDTIVIVDVLYLLEPAARRRLLAASILACGPRGCVVVKEMAPRPHWKSCLAWAQEIVSVHITRITAGSSVHRVDLEEVTAALVAAGSDVRQIDLSAGRVHPHVTVVAHRRA
jgi:2-polyprenyl-3-methyl-5-hydroxy-6-metoxy-1,4-benzoquinol methylase